MPIAAPLRAGASSIATLLLLAGCATSTPNNIPAAKAAATSPPPSNVVVAQDTAPAKPQHEDDSEAEADTATYPAQSMTRQFLLGALVGDIAAQRGQAKLGASAWLELAKNNPDPRVARRALEIAYAAGLAESALAAADIWLRLEPDSLIARQTRLALLVRNGNLSAVKAELVALFGIRRNEVAQMFLDLPTLWTPKTDKVAIWELTAELTSLYLDLPEAHFASAVAARNAGKLDAATKSLDEALRLKPEWPTAIVYRAAMLQAQSPKSAIDYLRSVALSQPRSRDIRAVLARELSSQEQHAEAQRHYAELSREYPDVLDYMLGEALSAIETRAFADAERALERALATKPKETGGIYYYLGMLAEDQWQFAKAQTYYSKVDLEAYRNQAQIRLARVLAKMGNERGALDALQQIPAATPLEGLSKVQLEGQIWRELNNLPRAKQVLNQGMETFANNTDLLYDRALVYEAEGDITQAERDLRSYLDKHPDSTMALNALGYTLVNRTERFEEAEVLLKKALEAEPNNPVIIDSFGWLEFRRGRIDEAVKWLARAFAALPDPEVAAHYGEALWRAGRRDEARKVWEQGRKLAPQHAVLEETISRLMRR